MIWLVGLAAACLTAGHASGYRSLLIVSAALTGFHLAHGVMFIPDPLGITVLVVVAMLVVATLWALWSLVLTSRAPTFARADSAVTNVSGPVAGQRDLA
jgi:hypothetical protein